MAELDLDGVRLAWDEYGVLPAGRAAAECSLSPASQGHQREAAQRSLDLASRGASSELWFPEVNCSSYEVGPLVHQQRCFPKIPYCLRTAVGWRGGPFYDQQEPSRRLPLRQDVLEVG